MPGPPQTPDGEGAGDRGRVRIEEDDFFDRYRIRKNHFAYPDASPDELDISRCMFETFGEELAYVRAQDHHCVWTLIEDDGRDAIVNGDRAANRTGFLLSDVPWGSGADIVIDLT